MKYISKSLGNFTHIGWPQSEGFIERVSTVQISLQVKLIYINIMMHILQNSLGITSFYWLFFLYMYFHILNTSWKPKQVVSFVSFTLHVSFAFLVEAVPVVLILLCIHLSKHLFLSPVSCNTVINQDICHSDFDLYLNTQWSEEEKEEGTWRIERGRTFENIVSHADTPGSVCNESLDN